MTAPPPSPHQPRPFLAALIAVALVALAAGLLFALCGR
jgi:hypothetical protein